MRNLHGSFLYPPYNPGNKTNRTKNRCSNAECECFPPYVNVHHYECPLLKTSCPVHGNPFNYNLKSKKASPDECMVISFHPSLKSDKLFEPVQTFLSQTCEPDTKINFQYYSPRLSKMCCGEVKHCQIQTNPEDLKKIVNNYFVEKTKSFFSDKTNKMKKLKQCFNSPCNSVVHKSRSCTAIKEKFSQIFWDDGRKRCRDIHDSGDRYPDNLELVKGIGVDCRFKSDKSSHFLYRRNLDFSDGEKSTDKEKFDSDFIKISPKINNSVMDRNAYEMRSKKGYNKPPTTRMGGELANNESHFVYHSFVSSDPIKEKAHGSAQTEEASGLERPHEELKRRHSRTGEPKEYNKALPEGSSDENTATESSGSVYFTPFILVPKASDMVRSDKEIQAVAAEPELMSQWIQTTEYLQENVNVESQTSDFELFAAPKSQARSLNKNVETQTSENLISGAFLPPKPQMRSSVHEIGVQTSADFMHRDSKLAKSLEQLEEVNEEADVQTVDTIRRPTVVYLEPEMTPLRRDEFKGTSSVEAQTEKPPNIPTVIYYEPKMKFSKRKQTPENVEEEKEKIDAGVQSEPISKPLTVIYFDPESKPLRRNNEKAKQGPFFDEKLSDVSPDTNKIDKSVGTDSEDWEKVPLAAVTSIEDKGIQTKYDSDTSQSSYFDNSGSSTITYVVRSNASEESEQVDNTKWKKSRSDGEMLKNQKCDCCKKTDKSSCQCERSDVISVGVYQSKKCVTDSNPLPMNASSEKDREPKFEKITMRNEDNHSSVADLSDLVRIINENFEKMFQKTVEMCKCRRVMERKVLADKEVMTDISGTSDIDILMKIATRSGVNAQMETNLPIEEEMMLPQENNFDRRDVVRLTENEKPTTVICRICSRVINMTTVSVGTNTADGGYIKTKEEKIDIGRYRTDLIITEPSTSRSRPTENPTVTKETGIKNIRMSTKTFVTRVEKPPEIKDPNKLPPTSGRRISNVVSFSSDSSNSLQRNLRRVQRESCVRQTKAPVNKSRPMPLPRSRPTPQPRQRQTSLQCNPQPKTPRNSKVNWCQSPEPTNRSRQEIILEKCPFDQNQGPSKISDKNVCPAPVDQTSKSCPLQPSENKPKKEQNQKHNSMAYHVSLSPLWSKYLVRMLQKKLKKNISQSDSSDSLTDSSTVSSSKQKRNHDGNDGGHLDKKVKSCEREGGNIFFTDPVLYDKTNCSEFGKSQSDILLKFLVNRENETSQEKNPGLTKGSGFVWVPSSRTPQFFRLRRFNSAIEKQDLKSEMVKEFSGKYSQMLPKAGNQWQKTTENLDNADEKNLLKKFFKCSSCKSLTYLRISGSEIMDKYQNNVIDPKSYFPTLNLEDKLLTRQDNVLSRSLILTPRSHSLLEEMTSNSAPENPFPVDGQLFLVNSLNSEQRDAESTSSTENIVKSASQSDAQKAFSEELYSKLLCEKSDPKVEIESDQVETCDNTEPAPSPCNKAFNFSSSDKIFHDTSN